ncbi:AAA family ATPase [Aliarcobacter cryaerophilus]|uniref:AAA family ATPase n=1 Tax=Arcobacter sp. AZ-2023 TaxID=3074453 RepID=A0AA96DGP9_9BACT|nr:AAA family ATPase [Arcobacter sp. AZ-2023]
MQFFKLKKNNCHFLELSSGEKLFLNVLTNFSYTLFRLPDDYSGVMLFDEIELSLHPNWQKRLLKSFISIQDKLSKSKRLHLHLIFTSHSPFILSDLPKENIIFLEKGKQVYPFEDGKQTFGANIHTLLSNGFFMKDGLMGEFAKNKISKILNFLNGKNKFIDTPINQIKPIIEIIGEDFLREKLLKMYNEKFPPSKKERIKELKEELERLENDKSKI